MTNIRAIVTPNGVTKAKVTPQQEILVTSYSVRSNDLNLNDLGDIDISQLADGALLVYDGDTQKWQATALIEKENTNFNGGHF